MKTDALSGHVAYKAGEYEECIKPVVGETHEIMYTEGPRGVDSYLNLKSISGVSGTRLRIMGSIKGPSAKLSII